MSPEIKKMRIVVHKTTLESSVVNVTLLLLVAVTIFGFFVIDTRGVDLVKASAETLHNLGTMFLAPFSTHLTLTDAIWKVLITLAMGVLTTLIGAVFALVLGLFAARNLSVSWVSSLIRGFVAVIRAVPTVIWVLIFAVGAGLGSVAAVVGMSFHSMGYLIKAYSESFEEMDGGILEALKASGASWLQIVTRAVLPSSITYILSWTFVRFEINFTTAVAMGAAAGATGIGYDLFMASDRFMNIRETGYITWLILLVAIILEIIATRLKTHQRVES